MTTVPVDSSTPLPRDPDATELAGVVVPGLGEALFKLAALGEESLPMAELGARIDRIIGDLMHLPNLFIAWVDQSPPRIRFVYCRDPHDRHVDRPMNGLGLTDRVFLTRKSLLLNREQSNALLAAGEIVNFAVPSQIWLGAPLCSNGEAVGVMATQDYESPDNFTPWHEAVFNAVAPTVAGLVVRAMRQSRDKGETEREQIRQQQAKALFATVGHDVRSPLSVIQGYSDLLRHSLQGQPTESKADRIFKAAQELSAATERMLDYTSAEAAASQSKIAPTQLVGWVRSLESWVESAAASQDVMIETALDAPDHELVDIDGERLRQLLQHLVRVAMARPGIKRLRFRLTVKPVVTIKTNRLRLSFGLEALPAAGTPTRRDSRAAMLRPVALDEQRTYDGSTVSLAISSRLAEIVGADLRVTEMSDAPWRASLVFAAPVSLRDTAKPFGANGANNLSPDQLKLLARRVVVVDPDLDSRRDIVEVVAEATSLTPPAFAELADLREHVEKEPPAVIVASIQHGPGQVREIALGLRACEDCTVLPCLVVVSDDLSVRGVEGLLDAGADAYVPKPLNRAAMLVALSEGWLEYERRSEMAGT